ncbi:hypothetical protein DPMN_123666, partial [Dreissena polymorpha]
EQNEKTCIHRPPVNSDQESITTSPSVTVSGSEAHDEGIPTVDLVLSDYLQHWNGLDYSTHILKLLARFRLHRFEGIQLLISMELRETISPGIGHDRDHHMATPVSRSLPDGIGQGHQPMPDHLASAIRSLSGDNTGHDMTGTSSGTLITDR